MFKFVFGLFFGLAIGWVILPVPPAIEDGVRLLITKYPALDPLLIVDLQPAAPTAP